ncbi:cytochrome P450 [Moraxella bovis]|uniref:cytochrome P450 n=1 Tax=Moraxella bovis TaxID=476 RepID=UPI0022277161|nr:cytochrome P450 [Moraxella bovis]UYZ68317.1 cytochrome P450 [Moraxella bovis]UYZ70688.1 cytochrome P450 [Moraxella bovis]UYZ73377.1 cytochrome P450 [Moraxella bovis]UZA13998.1 cytochrome P450 [Moraxella bovis]UZA27646.1 cytochrome P450 [Moraxella bovis]
MSHSFVTGQWASCPPCRQRSGLFFEFFIHHPDVLIHLKANPQDIDNAVLEILRLHDPLITNRRRTTCPVTLHGIDIPKDAKITINWQSANRAPKPFIKRTVLSYTEAKVTIWSMDMASMSSLVSHSHNLNWDFW